MSSAFSVAPLSLALSLSLICPVFSQSQSSSSKSVDLAGGLKIEGDEGRSDATGGFEADE
jgi:hypothetical protein